MVHGNVIRTAPTRVVDVSFANYLPYAGVKPGTNVMQIQVEQYRRARVESLLIDQSSGVEYSQSAPQNLTITASPLRPIVEVG